VKEMEEIKKEQQNSEKIHNVKKLKMHVMDTTKGMNKVLTDNETNQPQSDNKGEDSELDKVDLEKKIVQKGFSILPSSEHEITSGSHQTMIPKKIDDSFAA